MHIELPITIHDLKIILQNIAGTGQAVSIKCIRSGIIDSCIINRYDAELDLFSIIQRNNYETTVNEMSVLNIEFIEFESFYAYKGLASKVFVVE